MPDPEQPATEPGPPTPVQTGVGVGLVLVLTVLLCVWAAFYVPLRLDTVRLPVSLLVAGVGNALLGRAGGRLLGTPGVLVPGILWVGLAVLLGSRRTEGDLIVTGDLVGTLFLAVGALGFAVAYGMTTVRRASTAATTPAAAAGR